ncbi:MAG: hypothetical protein VB957_15535 [Pseudomonadales bacterium]
MEASAPYCTAKLNYASFEQLEAVSVSIMNGRSAIDSLDFEQCGFTLLQHKSAVSDWRNEALVNDVHVPEVKQLAQEYTGCDQTIAYSAFIRRPATASKETDHAPIESVHSDYTGDILDAAYSI